MRLQCKGGCGIGLYDVRASYTNLWRMCIWSLMLSAIACSVILLPYHPHNEDEGEPPHSVPAVHATRLDYPAVKVLHLK